MSAFLVALVMLIHVGFALLEMLFWTKPLGIKLFGFSKEFAKETAVLALNQGLYNAILAAGLFWTFFIQDSAFQFEARLFFLVAIVVAGVTGALTAKPSIFFLQALPAILALLCISFC